jgi:hypothetical protein
MLEILLQGVSNPELGNPQGGLQAGKEEQGRPMGHLKGIRADMQY